MPSGAKKRKAAKKKKEQESSIINSSTNNNPLGNDDPKSQDERDSDGGDVGSPASQDDHNHQNPFSQREEEGKGAPSPVQSYVTEGKPVAVEEANRDLEESGLDGVVDVQIDKEMEFKNDLESSHVSIQHVKHDKSSSSSSSSDDESQASEKKSKEEASNYISEATSYGNGGNSEEAMKKAENETLGDGDSISADETSAVDNVAKAGLSMPEQVDDFADVSVNESVACDYVVKAGLSMPEQVDDAADISVNESVACDVVESKLEESEVKLLPPSNGVSRVGLEENGGKFSSSSAIPIAESSNVVDKNQDSGTPEYSEKQPLAASNPPVVQRTSIFSCCGLFDVFTGSQR